MTVYNVIHHYDTDGGYGDAIPCEEVIATFSSYEVAKKFVERYNNPHVYDRPYADLECGLLGIKESNVFNSFDENDEKWKSIEATLNYVSNDYPEEDTLWEEDDDN